MIPNEVGRVSGPARDDKVAATAKKMLKQYEQLWGDLLPVEVHRLAWTHRARIRLVNDLTDTARLLPTRDGFVILVSKEISHRRARTAIVHELAHTFFYSWSSGRPLRDSPPTKEEENFCFDVARRVLAPQYHLDRLGIKRNVSVHYAWQSLITELMLSRPVAARVLLNDYELACGVAGIWQRQGETWGLQKGRAFASKCVGDTQRLLLRQAIATMLENADPCSFDLDGEVVYTADDDRSPFVLATVTECSDPSHRRSPPRAGDENDRLDSASRSKASATLHQQLSILD